MASRLVRRSIRRLWTFQRDRRPSRQPPLPRRHRQGPGSGEKDRSSGRGVFQRYENERGFGMAHLSAYSAVEALSPDGGDARVGGAGEGGGAAGDGSAAAAPASGGVEGSAEGYEAPMEDKWDTADGNGDASTGAAGAAGWFDAASDWLCEGLAAEPPFDGFDDLDDFGAF